MTDVPLNADPLEPPVLDLPTIVAPGPEYPRPAAPAAPPSPPPPAPVA